MPTITDVNTLNGTFTIDLDEPMDPEPVPPINITSNISQQVYEQYQAQVTAAAQQAVISDDAIVARIKSYANLYEEPRAWVRVPYQGSWDWDNTFIIKKAPAEARACELGKWGDLIDGNEICP